MTPFVKSSSESPDRGGRARRPTAQLLWRPLAPAGSARVSRRLGFPAPEARLFSTHSKGLLVVKSSRQNLRHEARTISLGLSGWDSDFVPGMERTMLQALLAVLRRCPRGRRLVEPVPGTGEVVVDVVARQALAYASDVFSGTRNYLLMPPVIPGACSLG